MKTKIFGLLIVALIPLAVWAYPAMDGRYAGIFTTYNDGAPRRQFFLATVDTSAAMTVTLNDYRFDGSYVATISGPVTLAGKFNFWQTGTGYNTHVWGAVANSGVLTGHWTNVLDHSYGTFTLYRENIKYP
jgi:hypothetical protein